ncbi:MAG: nucleoside monophosphate kinase [Candidatus Staskawiczbacteria bacterium]|jgi:adenylate kinase
MKQVVILLGPPGAGKGTQGELLSDKLNLFYFETSKVLENKFEESAGLPEDSPERFVEVNGEKYDILNEKKIWTEGLLCSPPFVAYLVKEKIKKLADEGKDLLLAGSPRTLVEGREVMPLLKELYGGENIKIVLIELSPEQTIYRNSNRRICELMRHPILFTPETEKLTVCPLDGSKLMKRVGLDDPETIKVRIEQYKERTFPLVEYFEQDGLKVKRVNGEQLVPDVYKEILKKISE